MNYDDAADVERRNRKIDERAKQAREDLKWVLSTDQGRRFIGRLIDESKLFAPRLHAGDETTFVNLGHRDVGLRLYNEVMQADPQAFLKIARALAPKADK